MTRIIRFGEFELDRHTLELRKSGELVKLQQQPARVLAVLIEHAGDLVTREELRKAVWADDTFVDFDRGLNYCIRQIRTALGDSIDAPRYLETLRGRGYRFIGEVSAPSVIEAAAAPPTMPIAPPAKSKVPFVAAAALVALAIFGIWFASRRVIPAIGVAPLEAPAAEREWATSMHAQIVGRLSASSRTPVIDLAQSSRNTRWRVEGRVDRSAEQYRVTMMLRDMRDGSVPWSDIFSGSPGDWVDAQSEMAQRMSEIIRYRIEGPSAGAPRRRNRLPPNRTTP